MHTDSIQIAIEHLAAGRPVLLIDDPERQNEGELVFAAEQATTDVVAFVVRHTSGYLCVAMPGSDCDRLDLNPMCPNNTQEFGTAFTVTVDSTDGVGTGISAADRTHTIRRLADPHTRPIDFTRPGHVVPLRAADGGVLCRPGHTEGAVDLCRLAGLAPIGALAALVSPSDPTRMATPAEVRQFADSHAIPLISIAELIAHRQRSETLFRRISEARIPTRYGDFRAIGFDNVLDGSQHIALAMGDIEAGEHVLARLHAECLIGDVFGSLRCECHRQLDAAMNQIAQEGRGVVVYTRGRTERGVGILQQLKDYEAQDIRAGGRSDNLNSGCANPTAGHEVGMRLLQVLGVRSIRLIVDEPAAPTEHRRCDPPVTERIPLSVHQSRLHQEAERIRRSPVLIATGGRSLL